MLFETVLTPASISAIALAALSSAILYFLRRLSEQRRFYTNDLPKPPHDWFWGHAKLVGEYMSKITGDYIQAAWTEIKFDHKVPEVYYLDTWPFGPGSSSCARGRTLLCWEPRRMCLSKRI